MTVKEFKEYVKPYKEDLLKFYKGKDPKTGIPNVIRYHRAYCGFDIETTSTPNEHSYMYIWQFGFMTEKLPYVTVYGRTWEEFVELTTFLKTFFKLTKNTRLIVWIANEGYEFQFMRHHLGKHDELFAKTTHNPLYVRYGGLEFRDCLAISQGGLAYLAKTWTFTQKLVGDLDYTKPRNSQTQLTKKEFDYCNNDVEILSEFSRRIFDDYMGPEKYIPMTSTGILRREVKKAAKKSVKDIKKLYSWIESLFPKTKADYLYVMEYLFRGGFVHACFKKAGMVLQNMHGFDLKSSYPASAFQKYFPVSEFKPVANPTKEKLEKLRHDKCVIFVATFKNIRSTTDHTIESLSKCIKISKKKLLDNGRVRSADSMTVFLTELDYENYLQFYEWDEIQIHNMHIAERGPLPQYLLDNFYKWFKIKDSIDKKKDPQGYAISKTRVNGHFGLCCTRLCFLDVDLLDNGLWGYKDAKQTYGEMIQKQVLSPYWGVYICAHSRRVELDLLYKMRDEVAYSDTDSHKLELTENVKTVVKEFNEHVRQLNQGVCDKYGYDMKILGKIGTLEWETSPEEHGVMKRFKTLGAKRYICEYENDGFESTVSGLKKGSLQKYCDEKGIDYFEAFDKNLKIPAEITEKLTPIYINEPTSDWVTDEDGNTELMSEKSSVYLKPVSFKLTMDKDYVKLLNMQLERMIRLC